MPDKPNEAKQPTSPKPNNPPKKPKYEIRQLSAILQLNRKDRLLYVPLQFREPENFGLLDTGAIQSALTEAELRRNLSAIQPPFSKNSLPGVQSPNCQWQHRSSEGGSLVTILYRQQSLRRDIHGSPDNGERTHWNSVLQEKLCYLRPSQQHSQNPGHHPQNTTCQQEIQKLLELKTTEKIVILPIKQVFVPVMNERDRGNITGTVERLPAFERGSHLLVSPAICETQEGRTQVQITNQSTRLPSIWVLL